MDTIGERIAWIIRENGLKKVQFAARVGIHQSYVTQLIKGKNPPSEALIKLIASEFHIREAWLRDGEEPVRESEAPDALDSCGMPREFRSLFQAYAELGESQREAVLVYVRKCAEIVAKRHADESAAIPAMSPAKVEVLEVLEDGRLPKEESEAERMEREAREEADEYYQLRLEEKRAIRRQEAKLAGMLPSSSNCDGAGGGVA